MSFALTQDLVYVYDQVDQAFNTLYLTYVGAASNPLVALAAIGGDIDLDLTIRVEPSSTLESVYVQVTGYLDPFPAFEAYARADGGKPQTIFRRDPIPRTTVKNLPGVANRRIIGSTTVVSPQVRAEPDPG
jgi:hypothetical protein